MAVAKPTLKKLQEKINLVMEAKALFNVGDRVHVGNHPATGEMGIVTKTNGHGHTFVTSDSGKEHKFDKHGNSMTSEKWAKIHTPEEHQKAKEELERQNIEHQARREADNKIKQAHIDANHPAHSEIIKKLREKSGDPHLANLVEPKHDFHRSGSYYGSETESHVDPGQFGDLFHKVTKDVRIQNASPEDEKEHGITHYGSISYNYKHPGGGSNGYNVGSFTRHSDGHIEISKHVSVGQHPDGYGGDRWERKVVKHID